MRAPRPADYFEALAPSYAGRYARTAGLWHHHFFEGRRRIALRFLRDVAGGVVADVGAGPGPLTSALRARGCRVVAVDRAPGMLVRAAAGGASSVAGDALALPLRDGSCSAASALGLASYVDDLEALLRELARVVRPGGSVVVSVASSVSPDWWTRRLLRRAAAFSRERGVLTSGMTLRTRAPAEWRRAARAAGLEVAAARGHDFTLFPLSRLFPGPSVALGWALEALDRGALAPLASETVALLRVPGPPREPARRPTRPLRVVRVIARLNVGGPALHTTLATAGLRPGVETILATGRVGPGEREAEDLLRRFDVEPVRVRGLGRSLAPGDDLRALGGLLSLLRRVRPDVVHTHTAKAGALGRLAALVCGVPAVVHTFHGHVFEGYFGRSASRAAVAVERALARITDRVVAVSDEVGRDLCERFRVVPREKLRVVPVGLPLDELLRCEEHLGALRRELDLDPRARVVLFTGRLVPVKDPHTALDAWRTVRRAVPDAVLVVVGSGPLEAELRARAEAGVRFLGWRRDLPRLLADAELALLSSRNEGTPVALVEAAAAGVPAVATRVGGVASVVVDGVTGLLVPPGDPAALARAVTELLGDSARRSAMGAAARARARERWSAERLLADLARLYAELTPGAPSAPAPRP